MNYLLFVQMILQILVIFMLVGNLRRLNYVERIIDERHKMTIADVVLDMLDDELKERDKLAMVIDSKEKVIRTFVSSRDLEESLDLLKRVKQTMLEEWGYLMTFESFEGSDVEEIIMENLEKMGVVEKQSEEEKED